MIPKNVFQDSKIYITKGGILRYIERDIFNPSIRYLKYLKRSLVDYKERLDNYTKYLEIQNLTESVQKYLKISRKFRKAEKGLRNSSVSQGVDGLAKLSQG